METEPKKRITAEVPTVAVYSRHRKSCKLYGFDAKVGCDCPKQLSWYRDGKQHKVAAGTRDHEVAEQKASDMMKRFAGEPTSASTSAAGIDAAVEKFMESKSKENITQKRIAILKFNLECFSKFCAARGLVNLGDVRPLDVLDFRNSLTGHQNTNSKKVSTVSLLFEFARDFEMCEKNPVTKSCKVKKVKLAARPRALDEKQYAQLLAAVPKVNGTTTDEERRLLRSLVILMRWSGLAVRDAVTIERNQFKRFRQNGEDFFRVEGNRKKTGNSYRAILRPEIVEQVLAGARPDGRYLFVENVPTEERALDNLIAQFGTLFTKLGKVADLKDENGENAFTGSHALRHTFCAGLFNEGIPTEAVARLIGDSVKTVIDHYSVMIKSRDEKIDERMVAMLSAKPLTAAAGR